MERARRRLQREFRTIVFEISRPVGRIVSIDDRRVLARRFIPTTSLMGGHRTFCRDAKKFSPKQERERVGAMSGKPCPLHDQKRNRPCKQSNNPLDICAQGPLPA